MELTDHFPLPTLDTPEFPVRRDSDNLISEVQVDGEWVSIDNYVDALSEERARLWRRCRNASLTRAARRNMLNDPNVPHKEDFEKDGTVYPPLPAKLADPCTAVAVDRLTGQVTEGHNNLNLDRDEFHPLVQARIESYLEQCRIELTELPPWGQPYRHPSIPGIHCEITSVSELLWRRQAAGLPVDESSFAELVIDNDFPFTARTDAACCANCTGIIPDVPCISGKLESYPAKTSVRRPR